jgi:hypothetical protein
VIAENATRLNAPEFQPCTRSILSIAPVLSEGIIPLPFMALTAETIAEPHEIRSLFGMGGKREMRCAHDTCWDRKAAIVSLLEPFIQ